MLKTRRDTYIVFDFETSGLDPQKDDIIEIGYLKVVNDVTTQQRSILLKHGKEISPEIENIVGIKNEHIEIDGASPYETLKAFLQELERVPVIFGHNIIRFDVKFLEKAAERYNLTFLLPKKEKYFDTAGIYKAKKLQMTNERGLSHWDFCSEVLDTIAPGVRYNVGCACDELGISREGMIQHRALTDVLLTNEIYKKIKNI